MARVAAQAAWIESRGFDLAAFFGPALIGLAAFAAVALAGVSPVWMLWLWIVAFDGPHMLAAYSRAYGDARWRQGRGALLVGSFGAFLVGPLLLALGVGLGAHWLFSVFLLGMTLYSYQHVVRQHWGFVALYAARGGGTAPRAWRLALYAACWGPYLGFLLTHPSLRAAAGAALTPGRELGARALAALALGAWGSVLVYALRHVLRARSDGRPAHAAAYLAAATVFHGLLYFALARAEPVFAGAQNLDQTFLMLTVVSGMFHSAQYVALVGLFHVRSSAEGDGTWWGRRAGRALCVLVPFLALYVALACATRLYPGCAVWGADAAGTASPSGASRLAVALWWGFALQHYWLDERLWHVRSDERLRRILALEGAQLPAGSPVRPRSA